MAPDMLAPEDRSGFAFLLTDTGGKVLLAILFFAVIVVPVFNLWIPEGAPFHLSTFYVGLFGKYLTFALLALSVDLIWGYCGILSLGHGAFFALGGYAMGMHMMREIGTRTRLNLWGNVYPRGGFLHQADDYKAGAVVAQRAGDVVTRRGQLHVYQPLMANARDGYWPAGALIESDAARSVKNATSHAQSGERRASRGPSRSCWTSTVPISMRWSDT